MNEFTAADDEILNGIVEILWGDAWASHVEECGCHDISGCEITAVMPVPPQEAVDAAYALASRVVEKHGMTLSEMFTSRLETEAVETGEWLDHDDIKLQTRFGNCIAWEAMGAGVSWADDHSVSALDRYVHFENCDLMMHADATCEECQLVVHVISRDEYTDEEGNTHSEWAPGRWGSVSLDVHAKNYRQAKAWADRHQSIDGSSWETARDLDGLVYTITSDRPGLIADLEAEGYELDLSEYTETPCGLIRTTYEIVTPESAEEGDAAERGWEDEEGTPYTEEEAIAKLRGCEPSSTQFHPGVWYTDADADVDYSDGSERRDSYHLVGFPESIQRKIYDAVTRR